MFKLATLLQNVVGLVGIISIIMTIAIIVNNYMITTEISERLNLQSRVEDLEVSNGRRDQEFMAQKDECNAILEWHRAAHSNEKPHSALKSERNQ